MTKKLLTDLESLGHRAIATGIETFLAVLIVDGATSLNASNFELAALSGIAAALVPVKDFFTKRARA